MLILHFAFLLDVLFLRCGLQKYTFQVISFRIEHTLSLSRLAKVLNLISHYYRPFSYSTKEPGSSVIFKHFYTQGAIEWRKSFYHNCAHSKILHTVAKYNLVPRAFLRHTLITKPNEHPGTLRSNAPRIWVHLEAIMDFTVGKATQINRKWPLL